LFVRKVMAGSILFESDYHHDDYHHDDLLVKPTLDYIEYISPDRIHQKRLIARIPIKLGPTSFVTASFILDTTLANDMYVSSRLLRVLHENNRIKETGGLPYIEVIINGSPTDVFIHENHENVNIIGLPLLQKLGLVLEGDEFKFKLYVTNF